MVNILDAVYNNCIDNQSEATESMESLDQLNLTNKEDSDILADSEKLDSFAEEQLFLDSDSEAENFFDMEPSVDYETEISTPDYLSMEEPQEIIPVESLMEDPSPETDNSSLDEKNAQELEEQFLQWLAKPETRDMILIVTGLKHSYKSSKGDYKDFGMKFSSAVKHNAAIALYPKLVQLLPYDKFNCKDGQLLLNLNKKNFTDIISPIVPKVDLLQADESPMVMLLSDILNQNKDSVQQKKDDISGYGFLDKLEVNPEDVTDPEYISIDQTDIKPMELDAGDESSRAAQDAQEIEAQIIEWLKQPSTRNNVISLMNGKLTASNNSTTQSAFYHKYISACRHNIAISAYPKMAKAFVQEEFHTDGDSICLKVNINKLLPMIKSVLEKMDYTLADESPIVALFKNFCDEYQNLQEKKTINKLKDIKYSDNAPDKGDLNLTNADVEDDLNLALPEEYTVSYEAPGYDSDDAVGKLNSYDPGFVAPLENHVADKSTQSQYIYVDNADALGQQSVHTNNSDTPILNKNQWEDLPPNETPYLPNGLGMPLYTVGSNEDINLDNQPKETSHNILEGISLTDLANKTIATYFAERNIFNPADIYNRLKQEGMKSQRINEIVGMVKYLNIK